MKINSKQLEFGIRLCWILLVYIGFSGCKAPETESARGLNRMLVLDPNEREPYISALLQRIQQLNRSPDGRTFRIYVYTDTDYRRTEHMLRACFKRAAVLWIKLEVERIREAMEIKAQLIEDASVASAKSPIKVSDIELWESKEVFNWILGEDPITRKKTIDLIASSIAITFTPEIELARDFRPAAAVLLERKIATGFHDVVQERGNIRYMEVVSLDDFQLSEAIDELLRIESKISEPALEDRLKVIRFRVH